MAKRERKTVRDDLAEAARSALLIFGPHVDKTGRLTIGPASAITREAEIAAEDPRDFAMEYTFGEPARLTGDLMRSDAFGEAIEGLFGQDMSPEEIEAGRERLRTMRVPLVEDEDNTYQRRMDARGGRTSADTVGDLAGLGVSALGAGLAGRSAARGVRRATRSRARPRGGGGGGAVRLIPVDRDQQVETSWGKTLEARSGRDYIVEASPDDRWVIRRDIGDTTYEPAGDGLFRKRSDIDYPYRRATERETIETLEGPVTADPGDYVMTGTVGEEWPVKPEVFERKYENIGSLLDEGLAALPGRIETATRPLTDPGRISHARRLERTAEAIPQPLRRGQRYGLRSEIAGREVVNSPVDAGRRPERAARQASDRATLEQAARALLDPGPVHDVGLIDRADDIVGALQTEGLDYVGRAHRSGFQDPGGLWDFAPRQARRTRAEAALEDLSGTADLTGPLVATLGGIAASGIGGEERERAMYDAATAARRPAEDDQGDEATAASVPPGDPDAIITAIFGDRLTGRAAQGAERLLSNATDRQAAARMERAIETPADLASLRGFHEAFFDALNGLPSRADIGDPERLRSLLSAIGDPESTAPAPIYPGDPRRIPTPLPGDATQAAGIGALGRSERAQEGEGGREAPSPLIDEASPQNVPAQAQRRLQEIGLYGGDVDGKIGPQSREAIERLGALWGEDLSSAPIEDVLDRAARTPTGRPSLAAFQKVMKDRGFYDGEIDGKRGRLTLAAVNTMLTEMGRPTFERPEDLPSNNDAPGWARLWGEIVGNPRFYEMSRKLGD